MSKISKQLLSDYNITKKKLNKAKNKHSENINKISEIIKPYIIEKYYSKGKTNWQITKIKFCNDNNYKIDGLPVEKEWIKISEKEYDRLYQYNIDHKNGLFNTEIKTDYIYEPEYDEIYYKKDKKIRKYLRVYVYEWWSYGGYDNLEYDFLLSDIMDEQYLRSEKLKKLEEIV